MDVTLAALADSAIQSSDGKLSIIGLFSEIRTGGFPAVHPQYALDAPPTSDASPTRTASMSSTPSTGSQPGSARARPALAPLDGVVGELLASLPQELIGRD